MRAKIDKLHVIWKLMEECNCDYVVSIERLIRMAWRILSCPVDEIEIIFSGGEPTQHLYLPELLSYIRNTGKNARVILETNGSADAAYYGMLIDNNPSIILNITVSYGQTSVDNLRNLIDVLNVKRANYSLVICDNQNGHDEKIFIREIEELRNKYGFKYEVRETKSLAVNCHNSSSAFENNNYCDHAKGHIDNESPITDGNIQNQLSEEECWCVTGSNLVVILPNGRFSGTDCDNTIEERPLWSEWDKNPLEGLSKIKYCERKCCNNNNVVLPKFKDLNFAREWEKEIQIRRNIRKARQTKLPNPDGTPPSLADILESRLKRMVTDRGIGCVIQNNYTQENDEEIIWVQDTIDNNYSAIDDLVQRRLKDIVRIYEACGSDQDRQNLLYVIKAIQTGNQCWLHAISRQNDNEELKYEGCHENRTSCFKVLMALNSTH